MKNAKVLAEKLTSTHTVKVADGNKSWSWSPQQVQDREKRKEPRQETEDRRQETGERHLSGPPDPSVQAFVAFC